MTTGEQFPQGDPNPDDAVDTTTEIIYRVVETMGGAFVFTSPGAETGTPEEAAPEQTFFAPGFARRLTRVVNEEARRRYPDLARMTGMGSAVSSVLPRVALRANTPYPYEFTEDDKLYPQEETGFGRIIMLNREDGLREIHSRIAEARREHSWLFIPEKSLWIDIAQRPGDHSVESDQYLPTFLSYQYSRIELFHTHPDRVVSALALQEPWAYSENHRLEAAQPSGNDLSRHAQLSKRGAAGSLRVDHVVSHYGVTSYHVNDLGEDTGLFRSRGAERLITEVGDDPTQAIHAALARLRAAYVTHGPDAREVFSMAFTPIEEL
jgi:hypothetical protein